MEAILDMNDNRIINVAEPVTATDAVRLEDVQDAIDLAISIGEIEAYVTSAENAADSAEQSAEEAAVSAAEALVNAAAQNKLHRVEELADLSAVDTDVQLAWVSEVQAEYAWDAASTATADDWAILESDGVGTGRWILKSDWLTVVPQDGVTDDAPRIQAAIRAVAPLGKGIQLAPEVYPDLGQISFPTQYPGLMRGTALTELQFTLTPNSSPANAGIYAAPGAQDRDSTVAAANTISTYTITINEAVSVGEMIRVLDSATGGFRGNRYMVVAVAPSGGDFIVTVDRPILTQFSIGDPVAIWEDRRCYGHRIYGGGMRVTGSGTRMFEFIGAEDCRIEDVHFLPDDCESVASFDTFGNNNHFVRCTAVAGASGANNGFLLETQEYSSTDIDASGFAVDGVRYLNNENCTDTSRCWGNAFGISVGGEANFLGCNNTKVLGIYNSNTDHGIDVIIGSRNTYINAQARFNTSNVVIGDSGGGNVTSTTLIGNYSNALTTGVTVFPQAVDTNAGFIDTSGCSIGINVQGTLTIEHLKHHGTAATHVVFNTSALVRIKHVDINVSTTGFYVIKTAGTGKTYVDGGSVTAGSASELFYTVDTGVIILDAIVGTAPGASFGMNIETSATAQWTDRTNFSSCGTEYKGAGTFKVPRRVRSLSIASVGTTAVTTEETLKTFTIPANTAKTGIKYVFRCWGTLANNANVKTIRVRLGGTAIVAQTMPTSTNAAWDVEFTVWITGPNTQEVLVTIKAAGTTYPASSSQTKTDTSNIDITLSGQNGTASANDIVCRGMEVTQSYGAV